MKLTLPFWLGDETWENLKLPATSRLGLSKDLDPEQEELLEIFRTMDLRTEWCCRRLVVINNLAIAMACVMIVVILLVLHNPQAVKLIFELLQK